MSVIANAASQTLPGAMPVALRGDHLALVATDPEELVLVELGASTGSVTYGRSDLALAIGELDRRHRSSPGTLPIVHAVGAWTRVFNARDWDGFDTVLAEDLLVVDHRKVAIGNRSDRAELVGSVQVGVEIVPDMFVFVIQDFALAPYAACGILRVEGHHAEHGGAVEWEYIAVTAMRPDGLIHLFEEFDAGDPDQAMTRFHELA